MNHLILFLWNSFEDLGLSGLTLDLACGAVLAVICVTIIPVIGRCVGAIMDCVMNGLAGIFGNRTTYWAANYATFPGVILHELSHAAGAAMSGAKVTSMRLFEPDGETLGSVEFSCRGKHKRDIAFQRAASSCAPVIGGFVFISLFCFIAAWADGYAPLELLSWHGAFSMACHMDMSKQDMKNYVKGCLWLLPRLVIVLTIVAYIIGHAASKA